MSWFWLWFWKPFAEFLGGVALVAAIIVAVFLGFVFWLTCQAVKEWWTRKRTP